MLLIHKTTLRLYLGVNVDFDFGFRQLPFYELSGNRSACCKQFKQIHPFG